MITLISTPAYVDPADPLVICRWVATESPNNFRLLRRDWLIVAASTANSGGHVRVDLTTSYTGTVGNTIALFDFSTGTIKTGLITLIGTTGGLANDRVTTDIDYVAGMNITYLNDYTLRGGYYFEGKLLVNGVLYPLTIIASPDSYGYADLDVSGILRIVTSIGKTGDYSARIMKEPTKSGNFMFEYKECWFGSSNTYTWEPNLWWYGECVHSEEQGSNLHNYVSDILNDAPFLNQFAQPVYFRGLPFDLSFIMPEQWIASPSVDLTVTINTYDSTNTLLSTIVENVSSFLLDGYICSLTINSVDIPSGAAYFTAVITN
jgi:hypothetical protein